MTEDRPEGDHDALVEVLGAVEAELLRDRLAEAGLVVVGIEELAELEREAGAYRRMRQLVDEP